MTIHKIRESKYGICSKTLWFSKQLHLSPSSIFSLVLMGLYQPQVALLVLDDSLLPIARAKNYSDEQYESFFIRDKYAI